MTEIFHCALRGRGLVRYAGADAQAFLHNQLTCDVAGLAPDASTYGAYCTPKGRALATFLLWPTVDGYLMQLPSALQEPIRKRLSMYILRSKVQAADADWAQWGVSGPGAAGLITRLLGAAPTAMHGVAHAARGSALRLPLDRYLLVAPAGHADAIGTALAAESRAAAPDCWDRLDIEAGIATVQPETQEQFVPQMLNLDAIGGVSFGKGCYPGQEIVARMHYLGRLKERMHRARLASPDAPRAGDRLYGVDLGAQAAGTIVNAVAAADGGWDLLAVIQQSSVAAGPVRVGSPDGQALALLPLPYALPSR